jgi:dipeptidyl aminopeptidase/acylaminoacyl peptidase
MLFSLDTPAKLDTVIATEFNETNPSVSPNGRLLAFTSDITGRNEVYIRPLAGGAQRQVSLNGGAQPRWARSGKELFYVNSDTLFTAEVRPGEEFDGGDVRALFSARNLTGGYSVLPGDTAFVTLPVPATNLLVVVTDFSHALNRLFAKK